MGRETTGGEVSAVIVQGEDRTVDSRKTPQRLSGVFCRRCTRVLDEKGSRSLQTSLTVCAPYPQRSQHRLFFPPNF
jgi:hypothetical protein